MTNPTGWIWAVCCMAALLPTALALIVYRLRVRLAKKRAVITHTKDSVDGRVIDTFIFEIDEREIPLLEEAAEPGDDN